MADCSDELDPFHGGDRGPESTTGASADPPTGAEYTCSICQGRFETTWSDKEAMAEAKKNFPEVSPTNRAIVCETCYLKVMGRFN
jgi:DNA-directed RNA polymerase subunit RPC12/RpoP